MNRSRIITVAVAFVAVVVACQATTTVIPPGALPVGTWGGDSAGMMISDTAVHLHIACTYGDVSGKILPDRTGNFDVAGSYLLRAYPVAVGPMMPARFVGQLVGLTVTVRAIVNDTTTGKTVVRGPVSVKLFDDPRLGPCPICRRPIVTTPSGVLYLARAKLLKLWSNVTSRSSSDVMKSGISTF